MTRKGASNDSWKSTKTGRRRSNPLPPFEGVLVRAEWQTTLDEQRKPEECAAGACPSVAEHSPSVSSSSSA